MAERSDLETLLEAALTRRRALLDSAETNGYRLLSGSREGVPGLVAERYGEVVILQQFEPVDEETLRRTGEFYREQCGVRAAYLKHFIRDRARVDDELERAMRSPRPLVGEPVPEEITVLENGRRFAIRPYDGFSVGLFLDQRDNRTRVAEQAAGKDVLNLFAYTCSFSVAAAAGSAKSTASVDIAPRFLEWGRRNFALNEIGLTNHMFFKSDAADFLRRAKRQGRSYDIIILDPPSFAHGRAGGRPFSVEADLADLVRGSTQILRPGGTLVLSTNHRKLALQDLETHLRRGAGARHFQITATPPLPPDFARDPDHSKSIWVRLD